MRDYNMWVDVMVMGIPLAAISMALLGFKIESWLNRNKEVRRG